METSNHFKNGELPKSQMSRKHLNTDIMKLKAKTLKIIGFTCFAIGMIFMLGFIAYTSGTSKTNFIPFLPIGIVLTFFGIYLLALSKKKKDMESKDV